MLELFSRGPDEHVPHKQRMIGTSTDDSNIDAVSFVPPCIAIHDVDTIASIEIIDRTFSVDFPCLSSKKSEEVRKHVIEGWCWTQTGRRLGACEAIR